MLDDSAEDTVAAAEVQEEPEINIVGEGDSEEAPVTHQPFAVKILSMVQAYQNQNGLRHNDHLRYRQYCSRRLARLYNVLHFKHGRGRYKPVPFPSDFQDPRYLEMLIVSAERAWSYGVQLKADNAAASVINPRSRHHSISRFSKAVQWAKTLETACKRHADARTQLEAEAYAALLEGTWLLEREDWQEALNKLIRCRRVYEHLGLASEPAESVLFKSKVQELAPMIRECKFNLGLGYSADDEEETSKDVAKVTSDRKALSELSYRGHGLSIPSDKIKGKLMKCLGLVSTVVVGDEVESAAVIEKYGELSTEFGDALKDIHTDMIAAGAEGQTIEWRMLEAFARELAVCMNVERNVVLLWNHLVKLDGLQEVSSSESRKHYRPDEGMRFCDLLKDDVSALQELPETTEPISQTLTAYVTIILNCRCLLLAICHCSLGKFLEAASLLDLLHSRVDDVDLNESLPEPLARLHALFSRVQQGMSFRVGRWRCRVLAQLCTEAAKSRAPEHVSAAQFPAASQAPSSDDSTALVAFPPKFRDIPCKPLLFDLAYQCMDPPDLDELISKLREGEKKSGLIGRVAGGVGSRLGAFFGGRK